MQTPDSHCHCPKKHVGTKSKGLFSLVPGLLIALIPKCPFCILSYTSAITVCSSKNLGGYAHHWTSWISIGFVMITLAITLYNYKGFRTQMAGLFILIGGVLIGYSELFTGLLQFYYWGCGILVLGVWINGSLPFFLRKMVPFLNRLSFKRIHG